MRHAIAAAFVALLAIGPAVAQAPQPAPAPAAPSADSLAAARELVQVIKATDQFKALIPMLMERLKPAFVQGRPNMEKDFDAIAPIILEGAKRNVEQLSDSLADVYARNFSASEIRDLIAFYQTPTGQKLVQRQPDITRESLAAGQQFGRQLMAELTQQIQDQLRKRGDAN